MKTLISIANRLAWPVAIILFFLVVFGLPKCPAQGLFELECAEFGVGLGWSTNSIQYTSSHLVNSQWFSPAHQTTFLQEEKNRRFGLFLDGKFHFQRGVYANFSFGRSLRKMNGEEKLQFGDWRITGGLGLRPVALIGGKDEDFGTFEVGSGGLLDIRGLIEAEGQIGVDLGYSKFVRASSIMLGWELSSETAYWLNPQFGIKLHLGWIGEPGGKKATEAGDIAGIPQKAFLVRVGPTICFGR